MPRASHWGNWWSPMALDVDASPSTISTQQMQVRAEQIDILFRNTPFSLLTNLLLSSGLAWVLWDVADHGTIIGWWLTIAFFVVVRVGLLFGYRRRPETGAAPWHTYLTIATVLAGGVWGAAGWLFFIPDSPVALIFVTIVLAGIAAGSVPAYSAWPPAQYSAIPTALPIALCYLFAGGHFWVMGLMCLLYLANVLTSARRLSQGLIESLQLRLEKQQLVQQLQTEKAAAEAARAKAEEANQAKSRFLAAASHDLRQPLHAVNLFVEALRHAQDADKAEQVLAYLGASAQALEELLNDLLDISKLEAGLLKPQNMVVEVQKLFDGLAQELRPIAEQKGLDLGFVSSRLTVWSDPQMLARILRNIITNAIRYTDKGAVLVGCRRQGDGEVALAVYDTGPGIAPEYHEAIFREFYQIGNPERDRRKGLGLGLAIVDNLCRLLGHRLDLRSTLGRGSVFSVRVPVCVEQDVQSPMPDEATSLGFGGWAVLVIDDEPAICQAMEEVLVCWGCPVLTALSAQGALASMAAEGFVPDVIVADYRLRGGAKGSEAIAEVRRALGRSVPAMILTGDTAPERLREASASGYLLLHKPIQPARLRAALMHLGSAEALAAASA